MIETKHGVKKQKKSWRPLDPPQALSLDRNRKPTPADKGEKWDTAKLQWNNSLERIKKRSSKPKITQTDRTVSDAIAVYLLGVGRRRSWFFFCSSFLFCWPLNEWMKPFPFQTEKIKSKANGSLGLKPLGFIHCVGTRFFFSFFHKYFFFFFVFFFFFFEHSFLQPPVHRWSVAAAMHHRSWMEATRQVINRHYWVSLSLSLSFWVKKRSTVYVAEVGEGVVARWPLRRDFFTGLLPSFVLFCFLRS